MDSVSKEAREAAAEVFTLLGLGPCQHVIDGMEDDTGVVQAFARLQEATRLAVVEECAALVEGFPDVATETMQMPASQYDIAAAIRALQPKVAGQ